MNGAAFTGPLDYRYLGKRRWMTLEPLGFYDKKLGLRMVPPTFESDLASILALRTAAHYLFLMMAALWLSSSYWPQGQDWAERVGWIGLICEVLYAIMAGYFVRAGLIHDWEYYKGQLSKWQCDLLFFRVARSEGTALWRCCLAWLGVSIGGWPAWLRHRRENPRKP